MSIGYCKFLADYLTKRVRKGGNYMPSIATGRQKVLEYIEENNISMSDLAVAYGVKRQDMHSYLTGKLENVKGNQLILRIIADYRIR